MEKKDFETTQNVEILSYGLEDKIAKEASKYKGFPIAISGGIDSGTLASFIQPSFAISVNLPGGEKYHEGQYAKVITEHLGIHHYMVDLDPTEFEESMNEAVRAIGRPIPHFNIFPLWSMYKELSKMGVKEIILGDGPDETLCGYARNLIMAHLYGVKNFDAFRNYSPLINKVLPEPYKAYAALTNQPESAVKPLMENKSLVKGMNSVDMILMRTDMDDMSNGIAKYFGITNIRPYQDNPSFDSWQMHLPDEAKIHDTEYGKYILRLVAQRKIPHDLAWRKTKVGGPVYPVNIHKGWTDTDGEFGKKSYLEYQQKILNG